jgi:hypothetical protein
MGKVQELSKCFNIPLSHTFRSYGICCPAVFFSRNLLVQSLYIHVQYHCEIGFRKLKVLLDIEKQMFSLFEGEWNKFLLCCQEIKIWKYEPTSCSSIFWSLGNTVRHNMPVRAQNWVSRKELYQPKKMLQELHSST